MHHRLTLLAFALFVAACGDNKKEPVAVKAAPPPRPRQAEDQEAKAKAELAHQVVFADRISQGYLLLLKANDKGKAPTPPSRETLAKLAKAEFKADKDAEEVKQLLALIATVARGSSDDDPSDLDASVARFENEKFADLLGLHIEMLPVGLGQKALIPGEALEDPVLLRELNEEQRASLPARRFALLLRADYRNQNALRGLRLLQALVRITAREYDALIYDPDTLETLNLEAFTRRRLQSGLGNVADQVAVVPFPGAGKSKSVRLLTRGMRRFGSVDLELTGLPPQPRLLQQGTDLLYGLALVMARAGEQKEVGTAIELEDLVRVSASDVQQAYGGGEYRPARCKDCPGHLDLHLVERSREEIDAEDHVVAQVVGPREQSDRPEYDAQAWITGGLARLFGATDELKE